MPNDKHDDDSCPTCGKLHEPMSDDVKQKLLALQKLIDRSLEDILGTKVFYAMTVGLAKKHKSEDSYQLERVFALANTAEYEGVFTRLARVMQHLAEQEDGGDTMEAEIEAAMRSLLGMRPNG